MGSLTNGADLRLQLITALPKAELHVHIEGTLEPQLMFDLAKRNSALDRLPFSSVAEAQAAYSFHNLQSFLDLYYAGCAVLLHKQDFYDLTWAYLERAAADKVEHAEIFFDPQTHTDRGVPFATVLEGITEALADGAAKLGISSHVIMCFLRHLGPDAAMTSLLEALPYKGKIIGVGLDSTEVGWPPSVFQAVFERAAQEGFKCVAHAGEEGPPEYIWEALRLLNVARIDHGVKCVEDKALVEHLRARQIPLTVCPLSNVKLKIYDGELVERLRVLLSLGLCITINSDDPSYFGGYIGANFAYLAHALDLGPAEIYQLHANGFRASFVSDQQLLTFIIRLGRAFKEVMGTDAPSLIA